ncbi:MAG: Rne/Rng family ribonuclease [Bacteroidetes bacterium]|nr:Rne/Rng family ribonuclease [Bacteroidota bacterium]
MERELVIQSYKEGSDIALLENKTLVEFHKVHNNNLFNVGDIYLGKVRKAIPGLNAVFVDIGHEKDAFLHFTDLGPYIQSYISYTKQAIQGTVDISLKKFQVEMELNKNGKIEDVLKNKTFIPVQILKEPISTKGARLSCEISLAGRYVVLTPFVDTIGISKKIGSIVERERLKTLIESLKPKNMGVVVRTVAEGRGAKELQEDIAQLLSKWNSMSQRMKQADIPKKILNEEDKTSKILRDMLNGSFTKIVTNNEKLTAEIADYVEKIAPEKKGTVSTHEGNIPLFDRFSITKQVKSLFGKTVNLASGGYLIIEHTEAMHVIDINSGNRMDGIKAVNQEENARNTNLEAAVEIARQLRLRDLGGIISIDFIDIKDQKNKDELFELMVKEMKLDKAEHTVLPLSKFCVMEITRQRVKPDMKISTSELCPTCNGTGKIASTLIITDDIERNLKFILKVNQQVDIQVHPFVEAYLKKGLWNALNAWRWKYKSMIRIYPNSNLAITEFKFFDRDGEEIKM